MTTLPDIGPGMLNIRPSEHDPRDWAAEAYYPTGEEALPDDYDTRDLLPPIWNQGSTPLCAAFSAMDFKIIQERREYDRTNGKTGFKGNFSQAWFYGQKADTSYSGMTGREVMKILQTRGAAPYKVLPFQNKVVTNPPAYPDSVLYRIKNYVRVGSIAVAKRAILRNGAALIAVPVYTTRKVDMWRPDPMSPGIEGGHMMLLCGWKKKTGLIIRNSWGTSWGDDGYTMFPYEDWGMQWETWTGVDELSTRPPGEAPDEVQPRSRWFSWWPF